MSAIKHLCSAWGGFVNETKLAKLSAKLMQNCYLVFDLSLVIKLQTYF